VSGSLLTGMLGLQPQPTQVEALVYLLFAIPMGLYVIWPDRWRPGRALLNLRRREPATVTTQTEVR
jgi:high-affinity iron transporter